MFYEPPVVRYRCDLNDVIRGLFPSRRKPRPSKDRRIAKLLHFIDGQDGKVGWDLDHVCRELQLNISGPYAAQLFKRCTGSSFQKGVYLNAELTCADRTRSLRHFCRLVGMASEPISRESSRTQP